MIGVNEIKFNAATMRLIVQEYLQRRMPTNTDVVTCIKVNDKYVQEFVVMLKGEDS